MTTLELLNEIANAPAFMGGSERYKSVAGSDILYQQDIEHIRKDLEVLEILKYLINHLEATFNTKHFSDSGIMGTIIKDYFINNDITGELEEWLKNDK